MLCFVPSYSNHPQFNVDSSSFSEKPQYFIKDLASFLIFNIYVNYCSLQICIHSVFYHSDDGSCNYWNMSVFKHKSVGIFVKLIFFFIMLYLFKSHHDKRLTIYQKEWKVVIWRCDISTNTLFWIAGASMLPLLGKSYLNFVIYF